jgi:6-phosphogluconolactonase
MRKIVIVDNPDDLAHRAVERTVLAAQAAIADHDRFTLALTGGSTPEKAYSLLAAPENAGRIDWSRTFIFTGDERDVPIDDPRSNLGMAKRTFLDHIDIPAANIFPMVTTPGDPERSARDYADLLHRFFGAHSLSVFDLIHLGMGEDGHCASLFPGHPTLDVRDRWVVSSPPGTLPPPVNRVTFTYSVLNIAKNALFLVTGDKKAKTVHEIIDCNSPVTVHPSAGIHPVNGTVTWLLDRAAASKLENAGG